MKTLTLSHEEVDVLIRLIEAEDLYVGDEELLESILEKLNDLLD